MSYAFLTIKRDEDGQQIVRRPRVTDVIGHTLRGAFEETNGLPEDMARMLRKMDGTPNRLS